MELCHQTSSAPTSSTNENELISLFTQPNHSFAIVPNDEGNRSADPPPPGICTNHMVADGRNPHAHARTPGAGRAPSRGPEAPRTSTHTPATAFTLHFLASTVCTRHSKGRMSNTERSTPSRRCSLAPHPHGGRRTPLGPLGTRMHPGTSACASASGGTYPANQQYSRNSHNREAGVGKLGVHKLRKNDRCRWAQGQTPSSTGTYLRNSAAGESLAGCGFVAQWPATVPNPK